MSEQRPVQEIAREIIHAPSPEGTIFLCPGCDRCSRAAFALRRERDAGPPVDPPWSETLPNDNTRWRLCTVCGCAMGWGIKTHSWKDCAEMQRMDKQSERDEADRLRADSRALQMAVAEAEALTMNHEGHIAKLDAEIARLRSQSDADFNARFVDVLGEFGTVERLVDAHREAKMEARRLREVAREALELAREGWHTDTTCVDMGAYEEASAALRRRAGLEEDK